MNKHVLIAISLLFGSHLSTATEGMWLPYMLSSQEANMKEMGMVISAEDIYSINNGSLKDAIVSFGGFCTGEIISDQGLVLTNHHCGYGAIQSHSSVEHNYLEDGFWAMSRDRELANPDLYVRFVKYIKEVTVEMNEGVTDDLSAQDQAQALETNKQAILTRAQAENPEYMFQIKDIFGGNQFILIASIRYADVRLVGAPPSSIGKYGADTDNWVWPRHTGDFSLFRIYADANNNPAAYSEDNVPFTPYRSLDISLSGTQAGDFTFVYGFPGTTQEYLPAIAVDQMMNDLNPMNIAIRDIILDIRKSYMVADENIDIQYASKYASTSNAWKKWIGQTQGIAKTHGIDSILAAEERFEARIAEDEALSESYGGVLPALRTQYAFVLPLLKQRDRFVEIMYSGNEAIKFMWGLNEWLSLAEEDGDALVEGADKVANMFKGFYKNYNASVDSAVSFSLIQHWMNTADHVPAFLTNRFETAEGVDFSDLYVDDFYLRPSQQQRVLELLENDPAELAEEILESEMYEFMDEAFSYYINNVATALRPQMKQIEALQREYMAAQMATAGGVMLYPDANSTMRITYGSVDGFEPRDGLTYNTHTYLDGVIEKYIPGDYEFDLPQRVLDLYANREYGQYADSNGKLPVCFIASNHTSGGNSGSPALNAHGQLIGLNFDRVWEGTMSDVYFDPSICRNIMVDIRYVLWVVDVYAGAGHLVEEMNIVQ